MEHGELRRCTQRTQHGRQLGQTMTQSKTETTVNETPANEAPVNEAPANEAPVNEASVNETPANEMSVS